MSIYYGVYPSPLSMIWNIYSKLFYKTHVPWFKKEGKFVEYSLPSAKVRKTMCRSIMGLKEQFYIT